MIACGPRPGRATLPGMGESKKRRPRIWVWIIGALALFWMVGQCASSGTGTRPPDDPAPTATTTTARTPAGCGKAGPTCDAVPKVDGTYRVGGPGIFDSGIMAGVISTPGPRPGSRHCTWARESGPGHTIENTIDAGQITSVEDGPVLVRIEPSDYSFTSHGCQPWTRVSD